MLFYFNRRRKKNAAIIISLSITGVLLFLLTGKNGSYPVFVEFDKEFSSDGEITSLAWSPDGKTIAASSLADGKIEIWSVEKSKKIGEIHREAIGSGLGNSIVFTGDGKYLVTPMASENLKITHGSLTLWNLKDDFTRKEIVGPFPDKSAEYNRAEQIFSSDDEKYLAIIAHNPLLSQVVIYDTSDWKNRIVDIGATIATSIAFSPNSVEMAIGTVRGDIHLVDLISGKEKLDFQSNPNSHFAVEHLAFSPDGALLAGGLPNGSYRDKKGQETEENLSDPINIWRVSDGIMLESMGGKYGRILQLRWLKGKSNYLVSLNEDRHIFLWDMGLENRVPIAEYMIAGAAYNISISPDQKYIAATSGHRIELLKIIQKYTAAE